jgi:hypothetical protein
MSLSNLIKKGGLAMVATLTPASSATHEAEQGVTVAPVATVAVANNPELLHELTAEEESSIRAWLTHIEETDPDIIAELLNKCRADSDARRYFLQRAEEVPETVVCNERITCGECLHFERIDHPRLGHCAKGEPEAIAGLWDSDRRYCDKFLTCSKQSTDNQTDTRKDKHEVKTPN